MTSVANIIVNSGLVEPLNQNFDLIGKSLTVGTIEANNIDVTGEYSINNVPVMQLNDTSPSNFLTGGSNADLQGVTVTGANNSSLGFGSLHSLTSGSNNTAIGHNALYSSTVAAGNIAIGPNALDSLNGNGSTDANNIAIGVNAATAAVNGINNVIVGNGAGALMNGNGIQTGSNNVIVGNGAGSALTTGFQNILIGTNAGSTMTDQKNVVAIGNGVAIPATYDNLVILGSINNTQFALGGGAAGIPAVATPNNTNAAALGVLVGGFYRSTADPATVYMRTA